MTYVAWISENVDAETGGYGKCREVCEAMSTAFPELQVRKGVFHSIAWGERHHWWLVDASGKIIDPTARQHPDGSLFPLCDDAYDDLTDLSEEDAIASGRVATGKCMNCGGPCYYGRRDMCSEACGDSFVAYLARGES